MTAPTSPAHPCVEIRDPQHGKVYIDRLGLAWNGCSERVPALDAPPALEPSMSAESVAGVLAGLYDQHATVLEYDGANALDEMALTVIESLAARFGPSVLAAFEKARGGQR